MSESIIRLRRSETPGSVPNVNQLLTGELAVNSFDGRVFLKQDTGGVGIATRIVEVGIGGSIGKTIFVTKSGSDSNSGLNERDAKLTVKSAAEIADENDTVKVYAGSYVEDNPIILKKNVSVEGLELRNCLITPGNPDLDLFHVNDGVHVTDLSFVGQPSEDGAAIIAFVPLEGVSPNRYFDATRLIRYNLDYIARETVGFLTSGYSGFAGSHREQDAARLIDLNIDFISSEAVGYLTSTQYKNPIFVVPTGDPNDCRDDIVDIIQSLTYDLRATGNERMVGAALSYYPSGSLAHITGQDINGYDVDTATVDTLKYVVGIATHVINNYPWGSVPSGSVTNVTGFIYDNVTGLSTVTSVGHGVTTGDIVKLQNLSFTCPGGSGITTTIFPDGTQGFFFKVIDWIGANSFTINPGVSTIAHTYASGGTVEKYTNFQNTYSQVFDPSVIKSKITYPNFGGCPGVASSISQLVGIVTSAIGAGSTNFLPNIVKGIDLDTFKCSRDIASVWKAINYDITRGGNTKCVAAARSYFDENGDPLESILKNTREFEYTVSALDYSFDIARCIINNATWGGIAAGSPISVSNIIYDTQTGLSTITAINHNLLVNEAFNLEGLEFTCPVGSPGKQKNIISAIYDRITGITTVGLNTAHNFSTGDRVRLENLVFECDSGGGPSTALYPSGNLGFEFTVLDILSVEEFTTNVGVSTLDHNYVGGGKATKLFTPKISISTAVYDRISGIVTITAPGVYAEVGDKIRIENLVFECNSGGGPSTALYPSGNLGYDFNVIGISNGRYTDAANLIKINKLEIVDKSLASIALNHPDFYFPGDDRTTSRSRYYDSYRLIQQNKTEIIDTAYDILINSGPGDPSGNQTKCKRDIGYFVDAVSTDIFTGGNTYSIAFVKQYFDNSGSPITNGLLGEESQSIFAFDAARDLMIDALTNQLTVKDLSVSIGSTVYGDGTVSVANTDTLACSDVQSTLTNLVGIVTAVIDDGDLTSLSNINLNYGSFENGQSKCRRDIGYLVNALIADLKNDSNKSTREFVRSYYDIGGIPISNGLVGEEAESITAFNTVSTLSKLAITNQLNNRDLTIIADPLTGFNTSPNSCADVKSTIDNLVGIVTTVINDGDLSNYPELIFSDTYYFNVGVSTLNHTYIGGGTLTLGITTNIFPDNTHGVIFPVNSVIGPNTFTAVLGGSNDIQHTYVGGSGLVTKYRSFQTENTQIKDLGIQIDPLVGVNNSPAGCANVVSSMRNCIGIVTSILGIGVSYVRGSENPTGIDIRYEGNAGKGSFIENDPSFSPGTNGPVLKGPYIRNCTNFVPLSIGMKIDGFSADPGDQDDIGVQGSMSVDSYTQYNQGGIGVSITNGAYAQLVSIFTICTDQSIVTENGGQCDITNSNSSFGRLGLVSRRTSDNKSKSIYRYTGFAHTNSSIGNVELVVSGLGTQRPYDGQVLYIGELYFSLNSIQVDDGGSGYASANEAIVTIDAPTGPNGINAQAIPTVVDGRVTEITLINSGTQYQSIPSITISPPVSGTQASASVSLLDPLYYKVSSATLPSSGISTVTLVQALVNNVGVGETIYFERQSLQIASSHSFEYIGAGNNIFTARPSVGGVTIQENEVVKENAGEVIYTSTDQAGNFRIGDGVVIDQSSGTISGRTYLKSLFNNVTPFILALGD